MTNSKNYSHNDFLVTFFTESHVVTRMISEVIKNKENQLYIKTLGLPDDFTIPFYQEEIVGLPIYVIKQQDNNEKYKAFIMGNLCDNHRVKDGDCVVFKNNGKEIYIQFVSSVNVHIGYNKYKISKNSIIYIGKTHVNNISFNFSDYIAEEKHIAIKTDSSGNAVLEDIKKTVCIYVNGKRMQSGKLKVFDEIYVMGLSMVYMGDFIAVRSLAISSNMTIFELFSVKDVVPEAAEKNYFVSTPRVMQSLSTDEIEIDAPPNRPATDNTPVLLVLGPSLTMGMVMMASLGVSITNAVTSGNIATIAASGFMAFGMLMGSIFWPAILRRYQKRKTEAEEKYIREKYTAYISEIDRKLEEKSKRTASMMNSVLNPSPEILQSLFESRSRSLRLWERSYADKDFLLVRMGLGNLPSNEKIKIPRQGFQLYEDELGRLPSGLAEKYSVLKNVPMTIDMRDNKTIGIIGYSKNINILLNEIILNIITLHFYEDVKLVLVVKPEQENEFSVFKNVPHNWSNDKKVRYFASNPDEVHYIFNFIDSDVKERGVTHYGEEKNIPHYVIIVTEPYLIEKEALLRYINDPDNKAGITTLFAYGNIKKLPKSCAAIIRSDDETGYYIKNKNENKFTKFDLDSVDINKVGMFAKTLSNLPVRRDVRSLGIADRVSFLQMYKAGNVEGLNIEQHWENNNSSKTLAAPIGVMAGGEIFSLDIHETYHGCHGLVAGTTGSGKSEFLQAFVLSLAINYSPKEIAFVLVDFKGGDMARPFMAKTFSPALPHLAATISNLSGNILYRALVSLQAEINSRQKLFNESALALGVDKLDINSYQRYYKGGRLDNPLPHLVVIIDEFAQLKTQHQEFLAQLINVAQVGRSLGIHLILATQKPSGIVDPQIMSNSRFKVCLKVADKQDSIDMINKPDSAYIKNPGRLYIQVGYDEIYECVQSGYSGADYVPTKKYMPDEEITVQMTDNTANPIHTAKIDLSANKSDKTQLEAIVESIVSIGQKKDVRAKPLWLDMLPEKIYLNSLEKNSRGILTATIGLIDFVHTQEQSPLSVDFAKTGHIGLYGASGMGKTTFLQTLVYSLICEYGYTPSELNIYAMDFGGRNLGYLEKLPHTGGVVFESDSEKLSSLDRLLRSIIDERKRLFASNNCGTFIDYRYASGKELPAILVLIDNYASFREKYMDVSDSMLETISAGKTFGVYFVITGSTRNSIYYKAAEHISTYFTLKMNDPGNYFDILNIRPPIMPEEISGRGITVINKTVVEFQTALAVESDSEAERLTEICGKFENIGLKWNGNCALKISDSLETYDVEEIYTPLIHSSVPVNNSPDPVSENKDTLIAGTSRSGALQYGLDLRETFKLCVCFNKISDAPRIYESLLKNIISYENRRLILIDSGNPVFKAFAEKYPECEYINSRETLDNFIENLKPDLNARLDGNISGRIFIAIPEFNGFFNAITDEQADFMRKVFKYIDSPQFGIYFICGFDANESKVNDRLFMTLVVNAENYLFCPDSYEKALSKIETLPIISDVSAGNCYFCVGNKNVEIRW